MECPSCGVANLEDKKFCRDCGKPLPLSVRCAACGAENPPGKKFCADCSAALAIRVPAHRQRLASLQPAAPPFTAAFLSAVHRRLHGS